MNQTPPALDAAPSPLTRRHAIAGISAALGATALSPLAFAQQAQADRNAGPSKVDFSAMGYDSGKGEYVLPRLPYAYDAMEPHIDAQTMEIHHSKHHAGYVAGLNKAVAELKKIRESGDAGLIKHWSRELAFHGGGHVNHTLFWITLTPADSDAAKRGPTGPLAAALRESFGSVDAFKSHFTAAANAVEGGGWAWLMFEPVSKRLIVTQMEKQQEIYLTGAVPLLGVDVWEHAYYLRYQNRRADYVKAFWNIVNWPMVGAMLVAARGA